MSKDPIKGVGNFKSQTDGKCKYDSQDEPCEYCALRNLPCEKVLGPKTRGVEVSASPNLQLWNLSPIPADESLSERERFYLQAAYWRCIGLNGIYSIIYQHMWVDHGFSLPPGPMRYAAMAHVAGDRLLGDWKVDACEFVSLFHISLSRAIDEGTVSENELFALLIVGHAVEVLDDSVTTRYQYLVGILEVATYLLNKHRSLDGYQLGCLWKKAIAYARHIDSYLTLYDKELSLGMQFHVLADSIPDDIRTSDRRLTILSDWHTGMLAEPPWIQLYEEFYGQIHSLRAIFEFYIQSPTENRRASDANQIRNSFDSVELRYLTHSKRLHATIFESETVYSWNRRLIDFIDSPRHVFRMCRRRDSRVALPNSLLCCILPLSSIEKFNFRRRALGLPSPNSLRAEFVLLFRRRPASEQASLEVSRASVSWITVWS